jgi:RNA polymerase sigma-70 factor (ECF subfamily)
MRHRLHSFAAMVTEPTLDLEATVERARTGDHAAVRGLIELYQGRVARFVRSMVRDDDDWEDVAQAAFVKMILGIERLQSVGMFESWLFRIARNVSMDHLRRRRWRRIFIPWESRHGEVAEPARDSHDPRLARIDCALRQLPAEQRELILLMRERDWSYADLARIVGVSAGAVKARLFRARSRLRVLVSDGDDS